MAAGRREISLKLTRERPPCWLFFMISEDALTFAREKRHQWSYPVLDFSPGNMGKVIAWQTGEPVMSVKSINNGVFYGQHDCPGYEAETENYTVYWNVEGFYRVMDRKAKAQAICYRVLHTMNIPGINRVKWLHDLFLWILLLGGMVIVATGTVLSVKSLCWRKKYSSAHFVNNKKRR